MRKIFSLALGALMSISAWSYENAAATFTWAVGNEQAATVVSDAADGVKETKVKVGTGLTVGTRNNLDANSGVTMMTFNPASNKPGAVTTVMIEYSVKMKKGVTFTLTGIDYDALKQGTDGASYHWAYAVDGTEYSRTEVLEDDLLRDNKKNEATAQLHHTHAITGATAGQTVSIRFYVSGFNAGKLFCLSQIKMTGTVNGEEEVRAFTNFKVDFRSETPTWVEPTSQPTNVTLTNLNYHGNQHGLQGGTITVNVDGPVKFTLGGCSWGNGIAIKKDGVDLIALDNKVGCDNSGVGNGYTKFITWTYNVEEAAELSFIVNGYLPFMFAEACDFVPQVEVRYYDTDGKTLIGSETVAGGSELAFAYGADDVTVAAGKAFRGWFSSNELTATKVAEGIGLTEDLNLYAKATDIEEVKLGAIFEYDLTKSYFYMEDHEAISTSGGSFHDGKHGWSFSNGNTLSVQVAGNALLVVGACEESATGTTEVKDAAGTKVGEISVTKKGSEGSTPDGAKLSVQYTGDATTLTLYFTATNYIHSIKVYNIANLPEKDASTGYYIIAPNDAAGFIMTLESAEAGDKIFLPNGVYDLGERALTPVSKNNISIIGQSMEGTIIKNAPDIHTEGIGTTATLLIPKNVSGTYLQDLTLENGLDYEAALSAGLEGGRAVCLQDQGTKTICKNVRLLSYQDTYYSNLQGAVKYFEDCEISGTVDFICGDGSVYFKNNKLVSRASSKGGVNYLTASNSAATDKGYVFESCTVEAEKGFTFGRLWNNAPQCVFLNTTLNQPTQLSSTRWTTELMSDNNPWPGIAGHIGEFHTTNAEGEDITPASNTLTFTRKTATQQYNTILAADEAAVYTMEYTLGTWAATAAADATQAECEMEWENLEADAIYLAEADGEFVMLLKGSEVMNQLALYNGVEYTLRKANTRGGFGAKAAEQETSVEAIKADTKVQKIFRDGQLIIIKNNNEYNVLGGLVK